jgi:hypothetical protein
MEGNKYAAASTGIYWSLLAIEAVMLWRGVPIDSSFLPGK